MSIVAERPEWRDPTKVELCNLRTADRDVATQEAVSDPAHWAIECGAKRSVRDKVTSEIVVKDDIDWNTEDGPPCSPTTGCATPTRCLSTRSEAPSSIAPQRRPGFCSQPCLCITSVPWCMTRSAENA